MLALTALDGFMAGGFYQQNSATTGTAVTLAIPRGAFQVVIEGYGGGGGGSGKLGSGEGSGGCGGSYFKITRAILTTEWGTNLTYSVGDGGLGATSNNGASGKTTTVSGTLNGGAITCATNQSQGGNVNPGNDATGGVPTGGDINTTATTVLQTDHNGGTAAGPAGGAGGATGNPGGVGTIPGGGGAGNSGGGNVGGNGAQGQITFTFTG